MYLYRQLFEDKPPRSSFQAKAARGRAGYALRGRGGPPGSSGRGRGRAERGSGSDRKKDAPKSAEDLDKELEKFMGVSVIIPFSQDLLCLSCIADPGLPGGHRNGLIFQSQIVVQTMSLPNVCSTSR